MMHSAVNINFAFYNLGTDLSALLSHIIYHLSFIIYHISIPIHIYCQAALQHARLGDFSKYCAIMVDLGEWTAALALAPW